MNLEVQSEDLRMELALPSGTCSIKDLAGGGHIIEGLRFGCGWRVGRFRRTWRGEMGRGRPRESSIDDPPCPDCDSLMVELELSDDVRLYLDACVSQKHPILYWRFRLENRSDRSVELDQVEMLRLDPRPGGALVFDTPPGEMGFFSNGWQSWNITGALFAEDRFPRTQLGPLTLPLRLGAAAAQPHGRGAFTSEMFGVLGDRVSRSGILMGFLSQRQAFGGVEVKLASSAPFIRMWADCDGVLLVPGDSFATDWACLQFIRLDEEQPLAGYLEEVGRFNRARIPSEAPTGWSSWYQFLESITEVDLFANVDWAEAHRKQIPLDVIQLDDGFEAEVGDWFSTKAGFPSGLDGVSRRILRAGFVPGLWLAPFVARPGARILTDHPGWILRNRMGAPVNAGFIWDAFTRALDVTHPQVVEHVVRLVTTAVGEWGFEYIKLDFLYAGALRGKRHDPRRTRAQALRSILEHIRKAAGDGTTLVGCGCPLGSGVGIFDAMRIGADVAVRWNPAYKGHETLLRRERDMPSVRNAIHNIISRAPLHRRWWINDPDCLILRQPQALRTPGHDPDPFGGGAEIASTAETLSRMRSRLTPDETISLATIIALSGGSLFVSDHLPDLSAERLDWLARLLPPLPAGLRAMDWFDHTQPSILVLPLEGAAGKWDLVALFNWAETANEGSLNLNLLKRQAEDFRAVSFWGGKYLPLESPNLVSSAIPPHGVRLFSVRPAGPGPGWIGDTLHISQGLAVSTVEVHARSLAVGLDLGRRASGTAFLELPSLPRRSTLDGVAIESVQVGLNVHAMQLQFDGGARLEVEW